MVTSIRRRVSVLACAIATTALGVEFTLFGQSAIAQVVDLTCFGTQTNNYSPGLTVVNKQTTITGEGALTSCVVPSDSTLNSGNYTTATQVALSCFLNSLETLNTAPVTSTINWNNGKSSTVRYTNSLVVAIAGSIIVTSYGDVTDGEFEGDQATRIETLATPNPPQCFTPEGIKTYSGPVTLTFTNTRVFR